MKVVLLAAGVGSRIRPLTDDKPKSLLEVNGISILERMLTNVRNVGLKDVVVITGYLEDQLKNFINEKFSDLNVSFIRNDVYEETNTGYFLLLTKDFVNGDSFIKFDADVIFEEEVLRKLINSPFQTALCIDTNIHLDKEEVKVITDEDGMVLEVGKKLDPSKCKGESIGIEKISSEAGKLLFEELGKLMKDKNNWKEYYDDSYTTLVNQGVEFGAVDITGLKWVEIDTHEDYDRAKQIFS